MLHSINYYLAPHKHSLLSNWTNNIILYKILQNSGFFTAIEGGLYTMLDSEAFKKSGASLFRIANSLSLWSLSSAIGSDLEDIPILRYRWLSPSLASPVRIYLISSTALSYPYIQQPQSILSVGTISIYPNFKTKNIMWSETNCFAVSIYSSPRNSVTNFVNLMAEIYFHEGLF